LKIGRLRLQPMQECRRALGMCRRLEDCTLVVGKDLEPGLEIRGVVRPRLELGGNAKISAEEATAELGDIS
jgi:hypothetical protein